MHEKNCSVDRIILGGVGPLWEVVSNIVQKIMSCPSLGPNRLGTGPKWFGRGSKFGTADNFWSDPKQFGQVCY